MKKNRDMRRNELFPGCSISRFICAFLSSTVLSIKWSVLILLLSTLTTVSITYAYASTSTTSTPEQLEECKTLGIELDQCSEATILAKQRCTGPNCGVESPPPILDTVSLSMIIGSGIALVAGMFAVRKLKKVRKVALCNSPYTPINAFPS